MNFKKIVKGGIIDRNLVKLIRNLVVYGLQTSQTRFLEELSKATRQRKEANHNMWLCPTNHERKRWVRE